MLTLILTLSVNLTVTLSLAVNSDAGELTDKNQTAVTACHTWIQSISIMNCVTKTDVQVCTVLHFQNFYNYCC